MTINMKIEAITVTHTVITTIIKMKIEIMKTIIITTQTITEFLTLIIFRQQLHYCNHQE